MITYEDNGMYSVIVREDGYKIGEILSFEGRIWWYKPLNGMPSSENFQNVEQVKLAIKMGIV